MPLFISETNTIFFIHIPKAGGSTIEDMFNRSDFSLRLYSPGGKDSINSFLLTSPQHFDFEQIQLLIDFKNIRETFAVTRNPISRFKSEITMRHKNRDTSVLLDGDYVFKWLEHVITEYKKNSYSYDNHIKPQYLFINDSVTIFKLEDGVDKIIKYFNEKYGFTLINSKSKKLDSATDFGFNSNDVKINAKCMNLLKSFYAKDFLKLDY